MINYVGLIRDHTGSMYNVTRPAMADWNQLVRDLTQSTRESGVTTRVSTMMIGAERVRHSIKTEYLQVLPENIPPLTTYPAVGTGTPLLDAVGEMISTLEYQPGANDPDATFLLMVVTDGGENASVRWVFNTLTQRMQELQLTDRWSFVFRIPESSRAYIEKMGVPPGNIYVWEKTAESIRGATTATTAGFTSYYAGVSRGQTSTKSFFKASLDPQETKRAIDHGRMRNISSEVMIATVPRELSGIGVRDMIENEYRLPFIRGAAFYELVKYEKAIQPHKLVVIKDRGNGHVYSGRDARGLLGWPSDRSISASPGSHPGYDIFVQSTSLNRKFPAGSQLLYWRNAPQ